MKILPYEKLFPIAQQSVISLLGINCERERRAKKIDWIETQQKTIKQAGLLNYLSEQIKDESWKFLPSFLFSHEQVSFPASETFLNLSEASSLLYDMKRGMHPFVIMPGDVTEEHIVAWH